MEEDGISRLLAVSPVVLALTGIVGFSSHHHQHHHHPYRAKNPGCRTAACDKRVGRRWWEAHRPPETISGWAIPEAIVMCESKGVNEPARYPGGPAGYYQIEGPTWEAWRGPPPNDAAEHSKAEQSRVAAYGWAHEGPGPWECKA